MKNYRGININSGKVLGQVFCYQKDLLNIPSYKILPENVETEWARYQTALAVTKAQLLDCQKSI